MKKSFVGFLCATTLFFSCGTEKSPGEKQAEDSAGIAKMKENDTMPHEVRTGDGGDYAYKPDSCIKKLVLGNAQSWVDFCKENGSSMFKLENNFRTGCYFNSQRTENMQVGVTQDEKGNELVYSMIIQKSGDDKSPNLLGHPIPASDLNFISGSGIYLGMSQDYVMRVYTDQTLIQKQYCDTTFLTYKPKEKDGNYFKRYSWKSYTATYKFVDGELRRMEYLVNPTEFSKRP